MIRQLVNTKEWLSAWGSKRGQLRKRLRAATTYEVCNLSHAFYKADRLPGVERTGSCTGRVHGTERMERSGGGPLLRLAPSPQGW
jgi:hypothetical protein